LSAVVLRAVAHSGNTVLRQTCTPTLARPAHRPRFATCVLVETGRDAPEPAFSATLIRRGESVVSRRFWSSGWSTHRRHRLMTYALIASKTATLIAIMIKKNFPIARSPADPQRKAAGIVLCWQANTPAFAKGPPSRRAFVSQGGTAIRSRRRNSR